MYQVVTHSYAEKADTLRLSTREIARRAGVSHVTVIRFLSGGKQGIVSKETKAKIQKVIDEDLRSQIKNLSRLSGGATGD